MSTVFVWLLRALIALVLLGWVTTLFRVLRRRKTPKWGLGPEDAPADPGVLISIVVPARNEAANLGPCLDTVLAQDHPNIEVVVQDDGSNDGTGDILDTYAARDPRIRALHGGEALPEGWFGKPWALQRAQQHARGDWLVFIDADVRLAPEAVSRAVAYGEREGLGMVTGLGTLVTESFWERVLQPAVAGLILMGNDLDEVNRDDRPDRNMASGQFLAFKRASYDKLGQHGAVRDDILDDVGLARACRAAGVRYHCLFMRRLYRVRMYTNLKEIWDGWSKNLFAGLHYSWGVTLSVVLFLFVYVVLGPLLALLGGLGVVSPEWLYWGLAQLLTMQVVRCIMDLIWGNNPVYGLSHVPANLMLMALLINSGRRSRGSGVAWRGRVYKPAPRGGSTEG